MANGYYPRASIIIEALLEDFDDGSGSNLIQFEAIPRSVDIRRNDHRTADTFRCELDFRDFPLDPRMLRQVRVQIMLGDVESAGGSLSNDLRHRAFMGYVDVPEASLSESGEVVKFDGRDYTCLFLDYTWRGGAIDIARSLGDILEDIVAQVPGTDGIRIGYSRGGIDQTIVSEQLGRTKFATQANDDAWTVILDLCGRLGLVPTFELDTLLILSPADVGVSLATFDAGDDFAPDSAAFEYGENLVSLQYKRNFIEARTLQIEVRCWDEQNRAATSAKFPKEPILVKKKISKTGKVKKEVAPIMSFFVSGTYTLAELEAIAERIYNEASRQQIEVDIETKHMRDLNGSPVIPLLGNGDRITVTLGDRLVQSIAGMSEAEAVSFLTRGANPMDEATAVALVPAFNKAGKLARVFYLRDASHKWTRDDGYSFNCTAVNFVGNAA